MYAVSSGFLAKAAEQNARWKRKFTIGSSDYSSFVGKWPSISKQWDQLNPQTVTLDLSNEGQTFNFLTTSPTLMRNEAVLSLGFEYAVGSEELITMFSGTIDAVRYQNGGCTITLIDKFRRLTDRKVGDTTSPVSYVASSYLAHDLAWYVCSSLGGLSGVASTSNPDIDYASWGSWSSVFSAENVRLRGQFTGQTPLEVLRKISTLTDSAILIENNRIKFTRFSLIGTDSAVLNASTIIDANATQDDRMMVNKSWVSAAYDTTSKSFGVTLFYESTSSQVDYGLREKLTAETFIWLTDSVSAINLAQRHILSYKSMQPRYSVKVPLMAVASTVGDTIRFSDALLGVDKSYRVMKESTDLDQGLKTFEIDRTQYQAPFTLDVSKLDGTDVLT